MGLRGMLRSRRQIRRDSSEPAMKNAHLLLRSALAAVLLPAAALGQGHTFTDDFERPNGPVGNGWIDSGDNTSDLMIYGGRVSSAFTEAGMHRPISMGSSLRIRADLTLSMPLNAVSFTVRNSGGWAVQDGYGVLLYQDFYASMNILAVVDDGVVVDQVFFGAQIGTLDFTIHATGEIVGAFEPFSGGSSPFSFGPHAIAASGNNLACYGYLDAYLESITVRDLASFPNTTLAAELVSDPVLADSGGDPGTGPAIHDAIDVFDLSLDCSGMTTGGVYAIVLRPTRLGAPLATGLGHLWHSCTVLVKSSGVHAQNAVSWGAVVLPDDPTLVGIEYTAQGFCSQSGGGSRLSNGLVQTIGG
jgi:hypothetical protein